MSRAAFFPTLGTGLWCIIQRHEPLAWMQSFTLLGLP